MLFFLFILNGTLSYKMSSSKLFKNKPLSIFDISSSKILSELSIGSLFVIISTLSELDMFNL